MEFDEMVALLATPGDNEIPTTIYDDLTESYRTVYNSNVANSDALAGATVKLSEYDDRIKEYEAEISRLKSSNYDLMMANTPATGEPDPEPESEISGTDDLFE